MSTNEIFLKNCDSTHRYSFSCFDNHDRLAEPKGQLTKKNQSRTSRRNRNAEATADCPTMKGTQPLGNDNPKQRNWLLRLVGSL